MARRVHSGWPRKQLGTALETGEHAHEQLDRYHAVIARRARIRPVPRRGAYARADGRIREQQFLFALGRLRQETGRHLAQAWRCAAGSAAAAHHARPALLVRPADTRELLMPRAGINRSCFPRTRSCSATPMPDAANPGAYVAARPARR